MTNNGAARVEGDDSCEAQGAAPDESKMRRGRTDRPHALSLNPFDSLKVGYQDTEEARTCILFLSHSMTFSHVIFVAKASSPP